MLITKVESELLEEFSKTKNKLDAGNNQIINDVYARSSNIMREIEIGMNLGNNSLKTQFCLNLPQLSISQIYENIDTNTGLQDLDYLKINIDNIASLMDNVTSKVIEITGKYNERYDQKELDSKYSNSKIIFNNGKIFTVDIKGNKSELFFEDVTKEEGMFIQDNLHYIQNARSDNIAHFGIKDSTGTILAYCSFSILDRNYPLSAFPEGVKKEEVLNMTRAFAVNSAPKNLMSALYSLAYKEVKNNFPHIKYIMTYVNHNLLFNGSSFKGSSYVPKGTSPMKYNYVNGLYRNRKGIKEVESQDVKENKLTCLPIILLLRGTNKRTQKALEKSTDLVEISKENYNNG